MEYVRSGDESEGKKGGGEVTWVDLARWSTGRALKVEEKGKGEEAGLVYGTWRLLKVQLIVLALIHLKLFRL